MIEDKKVNSMESKKNKFDLFDYLKNHDAIVIALVTALVTITTTILNMAVYLYDKAYLHYFHVDAVNIKTHEGTLYLIVASIIWVFLIIFSTNNLSKQNDLYFTRLKIKKYYKLYLKKKTLNDQQKEILIAARDKNVVEDKPKILRAALYFDLAYAFLIFVAGLFSIDYSVATWFWLLIMIAFMSVLIFVLLGLIFIVEYIFLLFAIRKKTKQDYKSDFIEQEFSEPNTEEDSNLDEKNDRKSYVKKLFSKLAFSFLFLLLIVSVGAYLFGEYTAKNKRDFYCVEHNDELYVVVYDTGDTLIAQRVSDDLDTIYVDEQIRISAQDRKLTKVKFDDLKIEDNY